MQKLDPDIEPHHKKRILKPSAPHPFSAQHAMQPQSSDENSVRLSVKRVICDKIEETSVQIFILFERPFSLVL